MPSKPHSKTVRGTLDNPKTQEAIKSDKRIPQLGDATSLKPENDDIKLPQYDSAPPPGQGSNKNNSKASSNHVKSEKDLPHSKQVRGTLANSSGKRVSNVQLGDPVSLKAEGSQTEMENDVEREGEAKSGKSKL
ncbi:hypothetical protein IQ07DRAFT_680631 [Pyrenochaeta sp. DS3sAY3a]|nr:hypothetical protein IQ07DRAFT_680631 [Pyrenochaeta sp. DS3sAY3a]